MIPEFDERGYLPPGIHQASLEEVIARFGVQSEVRQAQAESLDWLVPLCKSAGIIRMLINGSFVTDVLEPNDVDCVLLQWPTFDAESFDVEEIEDGLPFLELELVDATDYRFYSERFFASDRNKIAKGLVEVILA